MTNQTIRKEEIKRPIILDDELLCKDCKRVICWCDIEIGVGGIRRLDDN